MAIQVTTEERMRLKTRARQRLLGAIVLLIATAIILPWLLDKTPRPLNSDVVIDMPEHKAAPVKSSVQAAIVVSAEKSSVPVVAMSPNKVNPLSAPATPIPTPAPASSGHSALKPAQSDTADRKKAENGATRQKVVHAPEKNGPVSSSAALSAIAHDAAAPVDAKPAATRKAVNDPTRYVVQLGAFSSSANVRQLCDRLKKVGVTTYTELLPSGSTRVRSGPFSNYAQADKTLAKISMAGIQAQIVPLSH